MPNKKASALADAFVCSKVQKAQVFDLLNFLNLELIL